MDTKALLVGIISFLAGGLLVSVAATTFDKPEIAGNSQSNSSMVAGMEDAVHTLEGKTGDEFDRAFISGMIVHHEGAVAMAKLAEDNAKHDEIKRLSQDIVQAQEKEIMQMRSWAEQWGYSLGSKSHGSH